MFFSHSVSLSLSHSLSSCCYVIEQMDCSVSGLLKVFSPHHAMVGRECAKKEEKKTQTTTAILIIIVISGITLRTKTLVIIIQLTDFALLRKLFFFLSLLTGFVVRRLVLREKSASDPSGSWKLSSWGSFVNTEQY